MTTRLIIQFGYSGHAYFVVDSAIRAGFILRSTATENLRYHSRWRGGCRGVRSAVGSIVTRDTVGASNLARSLQRKP